MRKWTNRLKISCQVLPIIAVILSYLSCTSKEKETSSIPIFSRDNAIDTVHMSSLIKDWHYVMLETNPECFIGEVGKIGMDDSLLFIESDSGNDHFIFVFSKNGKFIRKIGDKGKARNEYLSIGFWAIDKWNNEVLIGDIYKKKLIRYTYDGLFLGDIPFNDNFLDERDMYVMSKENLAFRRDIPVNNTGNLMIMDGAEEKVKNSIDNILKSQSRFLVTNRALKLVASLSDRGITADDYPHYTLSSIFVNKNIYARDPILNDTLYRWENNQFIPESLIHVNDCKANDIDIASIEDLLEKHSDKYKIFKQEQIVNDRYFFTEGNKGHYLIDLETQSIHHLKHYKLGSLNSPFYSYGLFSDENYLICCRDFTAMSGLKELREESNIKASSKEQELYDLMQEDGNPVFFFYEFVN